MVALAFFGHSGIWLAVVLGYFTWVLHKHYLPILLQKQENPWYVFIIGFQYIIAFVMAPFWWVGIKIQAVTRGKNKLPHTQYTLDLQEFYRL